MWRTVEDLEDSEASSSGLFEPSPCSRFALDGVLVETIDSRAARSSFGKVLRHGQKEGGFVKSQMQIFTKRIRLTRSIFLGGEHAEKGSVHTIAKPLADDLIRDGSAVPLRKVWLVVVAACIALGVAVLRWCRALGWW